MKSKIFKSLQLAGIGFLLSFAPVSDLAPSWSVDQSHTSINFEVTHFFTPVAGTFNDFEGKLNFDPDNLAGSKVSFTVQVASVNTNNARRDKDLQSENFFNAKKFPEMKFESTSFEKSGSDYTINGKLSIRDVTKDVSVPLKVLGIQDHPMKKGKLITAMRAEFSLNRNDYGVGTGSWAATAVVGDEVKVSVLLEASRSK